MALTERLSVILEALGGASVVSEFGKVANAAKTDFSTVSAEANKAEATVGKLEERLSRAKPGSANYEKLSGQLSAARTEAERFTSSAGPLDGILNKVGLSGAGMGTAVAAGAGAAALAIGTGLVSAAKKGIDSFVSLGENALVLQRVTGGSAAQTSTFASVLRQLGVNSDDATKPLGLLAVAVSQHASKFADAGVQIAHYQNGNVDLLGTLDNVRQKFNETTDATQKDTFAKSVLGRGYQTLIPYLSATNEQVAQFKQLAAQHGEVLSQGDIEQAHNFSISMRELSAAAAKVERDIGSGLVPVLTTLATDLDTVITKADGLAKHLTGGGLGDFASSFISQVPGLGELVTITGALSDKKKDDKSATDDQAAATAAASSAMQDALVSSQELSTAQTGLVSSAKSLESAQRGVAQAQRGADDAARSLTKAQEGVALAHQNTQRAQERLGDAQGALNALMAKGAVDASQVASAEKQLESATRGVASAQQSLSDAQDALNKALAGASPDEQTDAQLRLQRATIAVAQAQQGVAQASLPHAGRTATEEASATLSVAEAVQAQKEAQEALDAVQAKGTAQDSAVISARRAVQSATQSLTDAIRNQGEAAQALRTAQAGDPEFDAKVAAAKRGIRDASDAVTASQRGERDAADAVRAAQQGVADAKDNQTRASQTLRDANYDLANAFSTLNDAGGNTLGIIDGLIQRYPELAGALQGLAASIPANIPYDVLTGRAPGQGFVLHAAGGLFTQAHYGVVAEAGPEGVIGPNKPEQTASILAGLGYSLSAPSGGGGDTIVTVNVAGSVVSERELTEIVFKAMTKAGGRYSALRN